MEIAFVWLQVIHVRLINDVFHPGATYYPPNCQRFFYNKEHLLINVVSLKVLIIDAIPFDNHFRQYIAQVTDTNVVSKNFQCFTSICLLKTLKSPNSCLVTINTICLISHHIKPFYILLYFCKRSQHQNIFDETIVMPLRRYPFGIRIYASMQTFSTL